MRATRLILAAAVAVLLQGCATATVRPRAEPPPRGTTVPSPEPPSTDVVVNLSRTLTVNGPFHGLGVQEDGNLLALHQNIELGASGLADLTRIVHPRLAALRPAFVRKMGFLNWLFPNSPVEAPARATYLAGQPATYRPWDRNVAGRPIFTPNSAMMQMLYADLAWLRSEHIPVILTISRVPTWMNPGEPARTSEPSVPDAAHLAIDAADIAWFVRVLWNHGFTNVVAVSSPNELAGGRWQVSPASPLCPGRTPLLGAPTLSDLYRMLQADLTGAGLSAVSLFGPDAGFCALLRAASSPVFARLVRFFDYHDYASEGTAMRDVAQAIRAVRVTGKQLWLTEIGGVSRNTWDVLVVKAIDFVNAGVAAVSVWNSSTLSYGDGIGPQLPWGLWGPPSRSPGVGFALRPTFYAWSDLAAASLGEHLVFANSCATGCGKLRLAVLGSRSGRLTIWAYNGSPRGRIVHVSFRAGGPSGPTLFSSRFSSSDMTPKLAAEISDMTSTPIHLGGQRSVVLRGGGLTFEVPALSSSVLTD
jgi:hypothetical protein